MLDATKRGDWMQTFSGRQFFPAAPLPDEVNIVDIASALSKMCRFGGHCLKFYSVAEHSVLVARQAPDEFKMTALMHDASEAYLVDIPRPVKPSLTNYHELENRLMEVIAEKYDFLWPLPAEVKRLDNAILADERDQIMARPPADWNLPEPALGVSIKCWNPLWAEAEFLDAFENYGGKL